MNARRLGGRKPPPPAPARCVAPVDGGEDAGVLVLCGDPAVTTRTMEGIECPLCAAHAQELDRERGQN